jgi:oxygen-independent coproporphyrinogen-3 oxidase
VPDPKHILEKFSAAVPRYTSYPTAPHFKPDMGSPLMGELLDAIKPDEPISVYAHIPFCDKLCWFCGCHTKHIKQRAPLDVYISSLQSELGIISGKLAFKPLLGQLHFGGGSPSLLTQVDFAILRKALEAAFQFTDASEISVEIDPSDVTPDTLDGLKTLGLTRASIGVQDFAAEVQAAINRPQSFELTRRVVEDLRKAGIGSLNIDALYGLPLQSMETIADSISKVIELQPDRVALFGYAHVPWMKKHQQMINEEDLPGTIERYEQAELAADMLCKAGYVKIGIDHFALPGDALAIAAAKGVLHRNFQGYVTDACDTLLGLGASSIGRFKDGYIQNIVATGQYQTAVTNGMLPAAKGFRLTRDDHVRAWIIERLMCDFGFRFDALEARFGATAAPYITEAIRIAAQAADGLCTSSKQGFHIADDARAFTRIVAARFDAYLAESGARYSRAV